MPVLSITAATVTSSLGAGLSAHEAALLAGRSGLQPAASTPGYTHAPGWLGAVESLDAIQLPAGSAAFIRHGGMPPFRSWKMNSTISTTWQTKTNH